METNTTETQISNATLEDFLPLNGTDHVEFYCGNAKQSAYYYINAFGYELVAYAGPETGVKDRASYVIKQEKVMLILTTSLDPNSPISEHVKKHGDQAEKLLLEFLRNPDVQSSDVIFLLGGQLPVDLN